MRVFACMASSLDGKIGPAHVDQFVPIGSRYDMEHLKSLRDQADAVIIGAGTFRAWPKPHLGHDPARRLHHFILSASLNLDVNAALFQDASFPVTIFTFTSSLDASQSFPEHVHLIALPDDEPDLHFILNHIQHLGLRSLLVEGGGEIVGQLLEAKLLQELYLTLVPTFIGHPDAPSLLGNIQLSSEVKLELLDQNRIEDETFQHIRLHYA